MSWKTEPEFKKRQSASQLASLREESLRQLRTNVAQILDAFGEIEPKISYKVINRDFLSTFDEWFWERNQKAKSADSEKTIAYINRLRRYLRIAMQFKTPSDQIHRDFTELQNFYTYFLKLIQDPDLELDDDLSYVQRVKVLEKIVFPRVGMEPGKGPDSCLVYLTQFSDLFPCLKTILTPTIPPVIPKKIERKLFGISEKIVNIFSGITLNFVTDPQFFDVTHHSPSGDENWKIPGISYKKVMEPFLSDFGVSELTFFKVLCSHIGLQVAENKVNNEEYFILDPTFVNVFSKIGYLQKNVQNDGTIVWYPKISEETLYLQYLALVATNRIGVQPDFIFWICLTFAYNLYKLIAQEFLSSDNIFKNFLIDDLVRVSVLPYAVKSIALELGGIEWASRIPVEVESRKDVLSGLIKISICDISKLEEQYDKIADELWSGDDSEEKEPADIEDIMSDSRFWNR